ncbi:hypothetical protein HQ520_05495 [bacterium]|nr:hypothetical protein [bacterium]
MNRLQRITYQLLLLEIRFLLWLLDLGLCACGLQTWPRLRAISRRALRNFIQRTTP